MNYCFLAFILTVLAIQTNGQKKTMGLIVSIDSNFNSLIAPGTEIEILGEGFSWTEGPVWVKDGNYLLFSDVKKNTIYRYSDDGGIVPFLMPSGYTGVPPYSEEPGSNGLLVNTNGELVLCEHGDRRLSVMPLKSGGKRTLADNYKGRLFNSPNDVVQKSNGDYYFTDPAYGLPKDSTRDGRSMGVYRLQANGKISLCADGMTPNGLAFSTDEKILYVAQSLRRPAVIYAFDINKEGMPINRRVFFDASSLYAEGLNGSLDGLKVDKNGNLFASGPGGILVITPTGKLLGRIDTRQPTSNCAWGDDGSVLYITANTYLCRIKTKTKGAGY